MKPKDTADPRRDDPRLLREEMLYYRLTRLKSEYLHGLEQVNGVLRGVKRENAQQLDMHQLLCLADSSVAQSLQALNMLSDEPFAAHDGLGEERVIPCGVCGSKCRHPLTATETGRAT